MKKQGKGTGMGIQVEKRFARMALSDLDTPTPRVDFPEAGAAPPAGTNLLCLSASLMAPAAVTLLPATPGELKREQACRLDWHIGICGHLTMPASTGLPPCGPNGAWRCSSWSISRPKLSS